MLSNAKIETIPNIMQVLTAINKDLSHFFLNSSRINVSRMRLFYELSEVSSVKVLTQVA
jgi:hypothetical protein